MTFTDRISSAERFLAPAEQKAFELDEATLIAIDHARNAVKNSGCMDPLSYRFLLQEQANRGQS